METKQKLTPLATVTAGKAHLELAPGRAWTLFLVTLWLSLAPRTQRHHKCHHLPMGSCSEVKKIQTVVRSCSCSQRSLGSLGRTGAFSLNLSFGSPDSGHHRRWGWRGPIVECLPWPSGLVPATQENTGLLPVWMEVVCSASARMAAGLA